MNAHCCIDTQTPSRDGAETLLRGWVLGEQGFTACVAEDAAGDFRPAIQGQTRADVAAAFPTLVHAVQSGFSVWLASAAMSKPGHCWLQLASGAWHRVAVDWSIRSPQTLTLGPGTLRSEAPPALLDALAFVDSIEDRMHRWLERGPRLRLRIDLINKCNLRCIMCHYNNEDYARRPMKRMNLEEFKRFFEPLAPYIGEALLSCADEPLLAPAFPEVLRYLANEHPHVFVHFCTNAMLLDERIRRVIVETGVGRVMFSMDGARRETFERIRKGAKFDRVIQNINALRALRDAAGSARPEIQINCVMMYSNLPETLGVLEIAKQLGAGSVDFHHAVPTHGIDVGQERLEFHPAYYNQHRSLIEAAAKSAGLHLYLPEAFPNVAGSDEVEALPPYLDDFHAALQDFKPDEVGTLQTRKIHPHVLGGIAEEFPKVFCEMPFYELFFASQESIMPCPFQRRVIVPFTPETNPLEVFFSQPFAELRKAMFTEEGDPGCKECPLVAKRLTTKPSA